MKVCTLCFVCNNNEVQNVNTSLVTDSLGTSSSCDYLKLLDSVEENSCGPEITENFVKNLIVKPVSVVIRRLSVNAEKYLSISQIQSKYRASSKLHMPRSTVRSTKVQTLKVNKKRRNHLEVRTKNTKTATVWKVLDQESIEVNDKIEEHM